MEWQDHKYNLSQYVKNIDPALYEKICQFSGKTFAEKFYRHLHPDAGFCGTCGSPTKFINITEGFRKFCCTKCSNANPDKIAKTIESNITKYGVKSTAQCQSVKDKAAQTCLERYGAKSSAQCQAIKDKAAQTCMDRYGAKSTFESPEIQEKIKQTCLERYGTESSAGSMIVQKRIKQTNLERYGVELPLQSAKIRAKTKQSCLERHGVPYGFLTIDQGSKENLQKIKATCIERYGVENPAQSKEVQEKVKQTCLERYGVPYSGQAESVKEKAIQTCIDKYGVPYGFLNTEPGYSKSSQEYFKSLDEQYPNAIYATKGGEQRVGPYLLDWYDPDSNTVIEFNGDYWHANPKLYNEDWIHPVMNRTAKEIWEHDKNKKEYLESLGYKVYIIWESDIK